MSNVLLTGGSGFIGSHFHNYLPQHRLISLDLNEPSFAHQSNFIKGDIRREQDIQRAVDNKNIRTIISLAAKHHDFGIGHDEYFDTNEDGTKALCNVATYNNINEIIFFSSVAVYGLRNEASTETLTPTPDSSYGASKLAGEKVLMTWAAQSPTRKVVIIRPTLVFGSNNRANMFNLIRQIDSRLYFHLGKAANVKSIAYVENVVQATIFLMGKMKPGVEIYNYADEPQLTAREISNAIAKSLHKRIHLTLPYTAGLLFGLPFDLLIKITGKNLPISTARLRKLSTPTHHSAKKIFAQGFKPQFTTHEGIKKMVEWYMSESHSPA